MWRIQIDFEGISTSPSITLMDGLWVTPAAPRWKRESCNFPTHLCVQQGQRTSVLVLNANMSSLLGDKSPKCQLFSKTEKQQSRFSPTCQHLELIGVLWMFPKHRETSEPWSFFFLLIQRFVDKATGALPRMLFSLKNPLEIIKDFAEI